MRIIAGKLRGKRLKAPQGLEIRPTSDRLRETLFSVLGTCVAESAFLDAFAGTGAVGLEAISRGARQVVFVESEIQAARLIRENLQVCGVTAGYRLICEPIFTALRLLGRERYCADLIFMDPPYHWEPYRDLLDLVFQKAIAQPGSQVVVEHNRRVHLPETGLGYRRTRRIRQGDHCLSFYGSVPLANLEFGSRNA